MKKISCVVVCLPVCLLLCCTKLPAQQNNIEPQTFIYRIVGGDTLKAYVFAPPKHAGPAAAVLLFHGGAWRLGNALWMFDRAKEFAADGMVAIPVEYRLANNGLSPADGVADACAAFAWARGQAAKFNIDIKRVVGYGVSAGGHLAAAAATLPRVENRNVRNDERPNILMLYSPALNMAHDSYFDALMKDKGDPASYSPAEFITGKLPPTLIIQGEQDSIVFAADARAFRDKAVKAGARCELYVYPGVGHLLTRNIKVQYKDFDPDPKFQADAHSKEDGFLQSLGYINK
jgi:acetyl esterase/lipase